MATNTVSAPTWSLTMTQDQIDVTSEFPSPDDRWRFTDPSGHEHYYEPGYPTLELVVDAQHWCDGNEGWTRHDPHMQIDESHYECKLCRVTVEPRLLPGGTRRSIPGMRSYRLSGIRSDGARVEMWVSEEEVTAISDERRAGRYATVERLLDDRGRAESVSFSI